MGTMETGSSILVVDDEEEVRQICLRVLSKAGYAVSTAPDAEQARRCLGKENFDLIIVDIHMPNEDGISLLKYVHRVKPKLPAMLITGYPAVSSVIDSIRLNVREYLCKPFTMQKLLQAVETSLQGEDRDGDA
jgi:DNA-binding NtrC family response regulator